MAVQFELTDGVTTVDLIATGSTGYQVLTAGGAPTRVMPHVLDSGGDLESLLFVERYQLKLKGSSHDNLASQEQSLLRLLRDAWRHHNKPSQQYRPVYLTAQSTNETNTRYALVYQCPELSSPSFMDYQFDVNDLMREVGLSIARFAWQGGVPGTLPSAAALNPMWVQEAMALRDGVQEFDSTSTGGSGTIGASSGATKTGLLSYQIKLTGSGDTAYGSFTGSNSDKCIRVELDLNVSDLAMAINDTFLFIYVTDGGTAIIQGYLNYDGSNFRVKVEARDDASSFIGTSYYAVSATDWTRVTVDWMAATAVGANDGEIHISLAGVLKESQTGIDNDTRGADQIDLGARGQVDAGTSGEFYVDNCRWARWDTSTPTLLPVSNYHDDLDVAYVFNYDDSTSTYSSNLAGTRQHDLFSVSGAAGTANDAVYIGPASGKVESFHIIVFDIATAASLTGSLVFYYWNGSAWTTLTYGTDFWIYPNGDLDSLFSATGTWAIFIKTPSDMSSVSINSVTTAWFRIKLDTGASLGDPQPAIGDIPIYAARNPYIEVPESTFNGDVSPLTAVRLYTPDGADENESDGNISKIIVGAKRGGEGFVSHLPLADTATPYAAQWTKTNGTDASETDDDRSPTGERLDVDFSSDATMVNRIRLTGTHQLRPFLGEYRAFVRLAQVGGTAGDINVKLRARLFGTNAYDPAFDTASVGTGLTDTYWEVVDLGKIKIGLGDTPGAEYLNTDIRQGNIYFEVHAERTTGSSTLRMADLILIPVDLWSAELNDPVSDSVNGTSALRGLSALQVDGGILNHGTNKLSKQSGGTLWHISEAWGRGGPPLTFEPAEDVRLYFLFMHYPTTFGTPPFASSLGQGAMIELYGLERWLSLRGSD